MALIKNLKPGAEYLSGLRKGDKLIPVITIVIYTGTEPWDGPLSLHDMLRFKDDEQKAFVPDYPLNIISAADLDDSEFAKFHTEIGYALKLLKHSGTDADKVIEELNHEKVSPETAFFLKGAANLDLDFEIENGGVDMCASLEKKYKEKEQRGEQNAIVQAIINLMESMKWTAEQAMNALKIPSDQKSMYAGMVNKK